MTPEQSPAVLTAQISEETLRLARVALRESHGAPVVQDWQSAALKVCRALLSSPSSATEETAVDTEHAVPSLRVEIETYEAALPRMLQEHLGEYAVIKGPTVHRFFMEYADAVTWGYETFGLDAPFCVKRVYMKQERTHG